MSDIGLRPKFSMQSSQSLPDVVNALKSALAANSREISIWGDVFKSSAVLRIPTDRRHYWSPELQLGIEGSSGGTIIRGMFGPRPAVWSLFIALYVFVAFVGLMGGAYGLSQMALDRPPTVLWSVPASIVAAAIIYLVARTGRRLGSAQMRELKDFLDDAIDESAVKQTSPETP